VADLLPTKGETPENRSNVEETFDNIESKIPDTTGFIGLGAMGQGMAKGKM
jgi:hypothetical protein